MPETTRVKYQLASWAGATVALALTALNIHGNRSLVSLDPIISDDTCVEAIVALNGNPVQVLMFDDKVSGAWHQSSAFAVFAESGTYRVYFTITGNAQNSTITVTQVVKQ